MEQQFPQRPWTWLKHRVTAVARVPRAQDASPAQLPTSWQEPALGEMVQQSRVPSTGSFFHIERSCVQPALALQSPESRDCPRYISLGAEGLRARGHPRDHSGSQRVPYFDKNHSSALNSSSCNVFQTFSFMPLHQNTRSRAVRIVPRNHTHPAGTFLKVCRKVTSSGHSLAK